MVRVDNKNEENFLFPLLGKFLNFLPQITYSSGFKIRSQWGWLPDNTTSYTGFNWGPGIPSRFEFCIGINGLEYVDVGCNMQYSFLCQTKGACRK